MRANLNSGAAVAGLVWIAVGSMAGGASAVTAEVAKKCEALTVKAYPPREPGNPAAGFAEGTGPGRRSYYDNCVAHDGNIPAESDSGAPPPGPSENTNAGRVVSVTPPRVRPDHSAYMPCPAAVAIKGKNLCLGLPGRGNLVGPKGRYKEYQERGAYRPCPASVAINGRNFCLGLPGRGYFVGQKGGYKEYQERGAYKPCPASVAIRGKNLCLG
jgi:hypothetical protein